MRLKLIAAMICCLHTCLAAAQTTAPLKIGVLTDPSAASSNNASKAAIVAVQLAIEEAGGTALGQPIELVTADAQIKSDGPLSVARLWFERDDVDAIIDTSNSSPASAINNLAKDKKKLVFFTSTSADEIAGKECNGYGLGFEHTLTSVMRSTAAAQVSKGRDTWFVILPEAIYGTQLENFVQRELAGQGGRVLGTIRLPYETSDFTSALLQAQVSGAKLVVSTIGGQAYGYVVTQAREFGLPVAGLADLFSEMNAAGLKDMQGQEYATSFHWNMDDSTREFAKRLRAKTKSNPTSQQAAAYSAALQYLKAVNAINSKTPEKVVAYLKSQKLDDASTRNGQLRGDGRLIRDMYLVRAKKPVDQTSSTDYFEVVSTIPGEKAFGGLRDSDCPMMK